MDLSISRFVAIWFAWGAISMASGSEIESIPEEKFFEIEDRILRSTDESLRACVKLCVSVDPKTGKIVFTGGNLDCVEDCHRSLTGHQGDQQLKEVLPKTTTAPTTTESTTTLSTIARRLFGPYRQQGDPQETTKEPQDLQPKQNEQQQQQQQPQQQHVQYTQATGPKQNDPMVAQESRHQMSFSAPPTPTGFFMKDDSSSSHQIPEKCKKIAEFDIKAFSSPPTSVGVDYQRRAHARPEEPAQSHRGSVPDIDTIFSTVNKGWRVLEDLCDIYSKARNFHMPESRPLSDKAVMCNVLQATSQDPNFQKDQCLTSVEVDDLIRGCENLLSAKIAHRPPFPHVQSLLQLQYHHKDQKHQHETHGHHGQHPASLSLTIPTDPSGKGGTSQKLALCVNAEFLRTKEVETIKNLETDIDRKRNLVERLEEKISHKCHNDHSTTTQPTEEAAVAFTGPITVSSKMLTEKREDLVSRRTCLRDFSMLRKTMNEVLAKLEEKYRNLAVKERTGCADSVVSSSSDPVMRAEGYKLDMGQQSTTLFAADTTPADTTTITSATNPASATPAALPPMASIRGLVEVDPTGDRAPTITLKPVSEFASPSMPAAMVPATGFASLTPSDNRLGLQQTFSTLAKTNN